MVMRMPLDMPGAMEQRALMSSGETSKLCLELVQTLAVGATSVTPIRPGDWFSHFTLVVPSTAAVIESLKAAGCGNLIENPVAAVIPVRSLSTVGGQSTQDIVALIKDLDGYRWRIMEMHRIRGAPAEPLCTVAMRVSRLESSLRFYVEKLGMSIQQQYEAPSPPVYRTALVGYGPELEAVQLELRQTEDPPPMEWGDGFIRLVLGTVDMATTQQRLEEVGETVDSVELGSVEKPGEAVAALIISDRDGWQFAFTYNSNHNDR